MCNDRWVVVVVVVGQGNRLVGEFSIFLLCEIDGFDLGDLGVRIDVASSKISKGVPSAVV